MKLKTLARGKNLRLEIKRSHVGPRHALETDARQPWVREFLRCARQAAPVGVDYFSDAGVLAEAGMPSVVFGPGDIAQAHTPDEWIARSQLEQGKDLLVRFFQSLP